MKKIKSFPIWEAGKTKQADILNAYVINLQLNTSATFWYGLYSEVDGAQGELLAQGNLSMGEVDYSEWSADTFAWDWVAKELNVEIIGDFVKEEII